MSASGMVDGEVEASPYGAGLSPLLSIDGISKSFGAFKALDDVSLEIAAGEVHCLLGENGAGKSTLCNLIFGVYRADSGTMKLDGALHLPSGPGDALNCGVAMVHQHFSLVPDLTVLDNLLLGQSRGILHRKRFSEKLEDVSRHYGLAVRPQAVIQDLSVGERQRVEIVKCLMRQPRLLILDEPTAVLLPEEIDRLMEICGHVAAEGCSVVLVTHKLAEIKRAANRVTVLRRGRTVARSDRPNEQIEDLVRAMIGRDRDFASGANSRRSRPTEPDRASAGDAPLTIQSLSYTGPDGVERLSNIDLTVYRGEIVGVAGVEGNGQSELGAILGGMLTATSGRYTVAGKDVAHCSAGSITEAGVGIVPEDRHRVGCILDLSLAENLFLNQLHRFTRFGMLQRSSLRRSAVGQMDAFDIRAAGPDVAFSSLSGGNQQKAVLAREISLPDLRLLVAAQPTRGLDIGAIDAIYGQIREAARNDVGILLISSELDELLSVADRIVVMYRGRIMGECPAEPDQRKRIGAMMAGHVQ